MTELLPCPFCSGNAKVFHYSSAIRDEVWRVVCDKPFCAQGPDGFTEAEAIAAWNTRAAYETDEFFYLPKPKQQLFSYTTGFSFDDLSLKSTGTVYVYAMTRAVQKWQEEALNAQIVERICEVFKPERTCQMFQYRNALGLIDEYQCSKCGADVEGKPNYCPNCGAKVVGE